MACDFLERHPEAWLVGGGLGGYIDHTDQIIHGMRFHDPLEFDQRTVNFESFKAEGVVRSAPGHYVYRKGLFEHVGLYSEALPRSEDLDLLIRVSKFTDIPLLGTPFYYYRLHQGNISLRKKQGMIVVDDLTLATSAMVLRSHGLTDTRPLKRSKA